jgi:hypothetical protein
MKGTLTFAVVVAALLAASPVVAQVASGEAGQGCSPVGTWIGGSPAAVYLMNIVPITPWRLHTEAQGSYLPTQTGNQVTTTWTGEVMRTPHQGWEGWAVQVGSASGILFPPTADITIGAVKSTNELVGCDTMIVTVDFFEIYFWDSIYGASPTKTLLVDPGDIPAPPVPIIETYHRVSTR